MDQETKKQVIIHEIQWWKESNLLPKQYCDYLLALYTEGNMDDQETTLQTSNKKRFEGWIASIVLLFLPILFLVIYFTELSFVLQMLLYSLFVLICYIIVKYWIVKEIFVHILFIIIALFLLLISHELVSYYFPENFIMAISVLVFHCFMWIGTGYRLKIIYFKAAGTIGLSLIFAFLLISN